MVVRLLILATAVLALASSFAEASDPSPLQDFCVAIAVNDSKAAVFVNGKICKNPMEVNADDFLFQGLNKPGNTSNPLGSAVSPVNVNNLPGLNTLGISLAPPGMKNKLFTKVLKEGDVFVFPQGLIHFQFNIGHSKAIAFAGLSSQNPGVITIANAVFGSNPPISPNVLTKAFQVDKNFANQEDEEAENSCMPCQLGNTLFTLQRRKQAIMKNLPWKIEVDADHRERKNLHTTP
nr:Germin-like protein subfamily 1 member 20 [Ipomoea batatas]